MKNRNGKKCDVDLVLCDQSERSFLLPSSGQRYILYIVKIIKIWVKNNIITNRNTKETSNCSMSTSQPYRLYKLFALETKSFKVSFSFCRAASSSSTALEQRRCTRLCRSSRHLWYSGTTSHILQNYAQVSSSEVIINVPLKLTRGWLR